MHTKHLSKFRTTLLLLFFSIFLFSPVLKATPIDCPLGFYSVWFGASTWKRVDQVNIATEYQRLLADFDNIEGTNATFITSSINNETRHLLEFEKGELNTVLGVQDAYTDQSQFYYMENPAPSWTYNGNSITRDLRSIINKYAEQDFYWPISDAEALIDNVVDDIQENFLNNEGLGFYNLGDEFILNYPLGGTSYQSKNTRAFTVTKKIIDKIRERDKTRPIMLSAYYAGMRTDPWEIQERDKVFSGVNMPGWNIWADHSYTFAADYIDTQTSDHATHATDYVGVHYHEHYYENAFIPRRELSSKIQQYADEAEYEGPTPEWWGTIQVQREWRWSNSKNKYYMSMRRPTRNEIFSQAYSLLALGAKGIMSYTYVSNRMDEDPNDLGYADDSVNLGYQIVHGLISEEYLETGDDLTNYRKPLSASNSYDDTNLLFPRDFYEHYNPQGKYPYDNVRDAYAKLKEILPIMRNLRWWWTFNGRYVFDSELNLISRFNTPLSSKFSIVGVLGDNLHPNVSSIYIGAFDNPDNDPEAEYYFISNFENNRVDVNNVITDNTVSDEFSIELESLRGRNVEVIWKGNNLSTCSISGNELDIEIQPADAMLIRISPSSTLSSSLEYHSGTISGPRDIDGHLYIKNGTVTLDGYFEISGKIDILSDATLNIAAGSTILFENSTSEIVVRDGGNIHINGTSTNPVNIGFISDDGPDLWKGIIISTDAGTDSDITYTNIRNAQKAIQYWTTTSGSRADFNHVNIRDCGTGYVLHGKLSYIQYNLIEDCNKGISIYPWTSSTSYHIQYNTISDITEYGVEADDNYIVNVRDNLIEECGKSAIKADNITYLHVEENEIRYCGRDINRDSNDDLLIYPVIDVSGATEIYHFFENEIIDNAMPAVRMMGSSTIRSSWDNKDNVIANNATIVEDGSMYKTEFILGSGYHLNFSSRRYDIFRNINSPSDPTIFTYLDVGTRSLFIDQIWWGETPMTSTDIEETLHEYGTSNVYLYPSTSSGSTAKHSTSDYWGLNISNVDIQDSKLMQAHEFMDSGQPEEANRILNDLLYEDYPYALKGFVESLRMMNTSSDAIIAKLQSFASTTQDHSIKTNIKHEIGSYLRRNFEFDAATNYYQSLANDPESDIDKLHTLIQLEETNLARLRFDESLPEDAKYFSAAINMDEEISSVEDRIEELQKQIIALTNGRRSSETEELVLTEFSLENAYPNPFNPDVTIPFNIPTNSHVEITIFNVMGQQVATLFDGIKTAGSHTLTWNSTDENGLMLSSGIYFVSMRTDNHVFNKKIVLLK